MVRGGTSSFLARSSTVERTSYLPYHLFSFAKDINAADGDNTVQLLLFCATPHHTQVILGRDGSIGSMLLHPLHHVAKTYLVDLPHNNPLWNGGGDGQYSIYSPQKHVTQP